MKRVKILLALCLVLLLTVSTALAAPVVPISQVAQEVNGKQTLTRVYQVGEDIDPNTLIEENLTSDGFDYTFTGITQSVENQADEKVVYVKVTKAAETNNLVENIKLFDAEVPYDEDGYTGLLHLDPKSISTTVTATEQKGGKVNKSATKTYKLDYNDPTLVPETIKENGYTLTRTSLSWTEGEYLENTSVPSYYIATATYNYSYTSYTEVPSEYTTEATYTGTVSKPGENLYTYTLTYTGTPSEIDHTFLTQGLIRGTLITLAIVAGVLLLAFLAFRILSMFASVQVQDPDSGEYVKIQRVRLSQKAPVIKLDVLKLPEARHYLITMRESCAKRMRGKIILVQAGQETIQHKVEAIYGKKYTIPVDLEA